MRGRDEEGGEGAADRGTTGGIADGIDAVDGRKGTTGTPVKGGSSGDVT